MSDYSLTKARVLQWIGIIMVLLIVGGAYWYFGVRAGVSLKRTSQTGLIGHWKFDEGSGTTAADSSGSGRTGTLTNGPNWAAGKFAGAVVLDGTDDYVAVTGLMGNPVNVTLSAWVNLTTADSNGSEVITIGNYVAIRMDVSGQIQGFFYNGTSWRTVSFTSTYAGTGWHHVVYVMNDTGNSQKLYVDGVERASDIYADSISYTGQGSETRIGKHGSADTNKDFGGSIDDVRIYNRALSATEVSNAYAAGAVNKTNTSASQPQGTGRLDSGLAGYWKLDENTGTSAGDSSTNGNTGTLTNGPTWTTGQIGSSVDFDGTDDYVTVTDADSIDVTDSTHFTLSGWFNRDTFTTDDTILAKRNGIVSTDTGYIAYVDDTTDKLTFEASDGTDEYQLESVSTFTATGWHHYVIAWDDSGSGQTKLYINGVAEGATATGTFANVNSLANALAFRLGAESDAGNPFDGKLDEARLYNRALSSDEVAQLYRLSVPTGVDTDLKGYWSFNGQDISGTTAFDRSGAGNTGTLTNGPTRAIGKLGQALSFDGTDDYVTVPDNSALDSTSNLSLSVWVKANAWSGTQTLIKKDKNYILRGEGGTALKLYWWNGSSQRYVLSVSPPSAGTWHHIVATVASDTTRALYINGVLQSGTDSLDGTEARGLTANLEIGNNSATTEDFYGALDEARVYTRTLSAAEIKSLYDSGQSDKTNTSASQPQGTGRLDSGLAGYWKLDENTGTSAGDASTNGNTGTLTNGPTWGTGQIGSAVTFDGSNDFISAGNNNNLNVTGKILTVSAWVKRAASNSTGTLVTRGFVSSNGYVLDIGGAGCGTNGIGMTKFGIANLCAGSFPADTSWHHLTAVWDGEGQRSYIDGVFSGSAANTADINSASGETLCIGALCTGTAAFAGSMDEVRVYHRALSADEAAQIYRLTAPTGADTSLKSYWSFNGHDMNGTAAYDRSGAGNTGTLTNGPTRTIGKIGQGLSFDGTDDYVEVANNVTMTGSKTVSLWVKPSQVTGDKIVFYASGGTGSDYLILSLYTSLLLAITDDVYDSSVNKHTSITLTAGEWYHVVVTKTTNQIQNIYINGTDVTTGEGAFYYGTPAKTYIGGGSSADLTTMDGGASAFSGRIDEVRVYNRVLSVSEITALYNASR